MNSNDSRPVLFISHIAEEKVAAMRLKEILMEVFANQVTVFVSSDNESINPGTGWFESILTNVCCSDVVISLLSPISVHRPWIVFEAGAGKGCKAQVIPIVYQGLGFADIPFPLKGLQGTMMANLDSILDQVSRRINIARSPIDLDAMIRDLSAVNPERHASSTCLSLRMDIHGPSQLCTFVLENNSNHDVEPVELKIEIRSDVLYGPYRPTGDPAVLEVQHFTHDGSMWLLITYRNNRERSSGRFSPSTEPLPPLLTPHQAQELVILKPELRFPLTAEERLESIRYTIYAKGVPPVHGMLNIAASPQEQKGN